VLGHKHPLSVSGVNGNSDSGEVGALGMAFCLPFPFALVLSGSSKGSFGGDLLSDDDPWV
jgi:hypothetical protein